MEDQPIDVLCINCSEMVPADQVTAHSHRCQQVHPYVTSMDNSEYLRLLDFKIEKLRLALQVALTSSQRDTPVLNSLVDTAGKLLKSYGASSNSLRLAEEVLESLAASMRGFAGSTSASLYAERLKALAAEKAAELRRVLEHQGESSLRTQLSQKDEEIERLRRELEALKASAQPPAALAQREDAVLDEVRSEAKVSRQSSQASVTHVAPESPLPRKNASEVESMSQDERKRYFFSQCLAIKLTFPAKSKAQYVKIPQLYEKVSQQKVAVEDWPDFIRNELASA